MPLKLNHIFLTLIFVSGAFLARSQEISLGPLAMLKGKIFNEEDSSYIQYAHVINVNKGYMSISDQFGNFKIPFLPGDSIRFSAIGYKVQYVSTSEQVKQGKEYHLDIRMEVKTYELPVVDVLPYNTYEKFSQAFVKLDIPGAIDIQLNLPVIKFSPALLRDNLSPGITISGPITAIYNLFSKDAKEQKLLAGMMREKSRKDFVTKRYNSHFVKSITGISEPEELEDFVSFCHLSDEFILHSSDYEFLMALVKCYDNYLLFKQNNN